MVCLGSCAICSCGTMNSSTCGDCEKEVTRRVLAKEPIDNESVKKAVEEKRSAKRDRDMREMLDSHQEEMGRNDWRKYMNERNDAHGVIDMAIEMIDSYGEDIPEMQSLRKLLDGIDTGRESRNKFAEAKAMMKEVFRKIDTRD